MFYAGLLSFFSPQAAVFNEGDLEILSLEIMEAYRQYVILSSSTPLGYVEVSAAASLKKSSIEARNALVWLMKASIVTWPRTIDVLTGDFDSTTAKDLFRTTNS